MAGIYLHIPFCKHKCIYCDFYSIASQKLRHGYCDALFQELRLRSHELSGFGIDTLYVGGGTPSLLPADELAAIVAAVNAMRDVDQPMREVTVEVNPDDITAEYAAALRRAGFNRVSMGVQTFDNAMLRLLRRRHNANQAVEAFRLLRSAGFENISLDLIFALPGQAQEMLARDLDVIENLRPEHLSCYGLMYEEGTLLYRMRCEGTVAEADDDTYINMYQMICDRLRGMGYEHYEVSNFALTGRRAIHNSNYWKSEPYLGLGAGAHSFDGVTRRVNPNDVAAYMEAIGGGNCCYVEEIESETDRLNDYIMVRLRTVEGISLNDFASQFGEEEAKRIMKSSMPFADCGDMVVANGRIAITEMGWLRSDSIISELMR